MSCVGVGALCWPADHVAAGHVDVVLEAHRDRHRREGLGDLGVEGVDGADPAGHAAGQHDDVIAGLQHASGHAPGVAAVVVEFVGLGSHDVLHREPGVDEVAVGGDMDVLEVVHQRRALVPGHVRRTRDDVVAEQGRDRDDLEVGDGQLRGEGAEVALDLVEDGLVVVDEVHLVDRQHDVRHAQQRQDDGVSAGLLGEAVPRVDQHETEVGRGCAGDHVARVLHVARGVGDDEFALGRGEVPVGDIDGDALLALRAQAVGQEGEVGVVVAAGVARGLDGLELVGEDRLGVEQEPTDECRLAVIDRTSGRESQQVHQK